MNKKLLTLKKRQDEIFSAMAGILGGISAPVRIKLIHFLSQSPLTVEVLAQKADQSVANTSMHLRKMLNEKIVNVQVDGQKRIYSLHPAALKFWESCQDFVQQIDPTLQMNLSENSSGINWDKDLKTTLDLAKRKEITLIDVRPEDEAGEKIEELNILHIPYNHLAKNAGRIPKRKPVLVICRGRFCGLSVQAVLDLRENGFKAFRLNDSWFSIKQILEQ